MVWFTSLHWKKAEPDCGSSESGSSDSGSSGSRRNLEPEPASFTRGRTETGSAKRESRDLENAMWSPSGDWWFGKVNSVSVIIWRIRGLRVTSSSSSVTLAIKTRARRTVSLVGTLGPVTVHYHTPTTSRRPRKWGTRLDTGLMPWTSSEASPHCACRRG